MFDVRRSLASFLARTADISADGPPETEQLKPETFLLPSLTLEILGLQPRRHKLS